MRILTSIFCLGLSLTLSAQSINLGQNIDQVKQSLGKPIGVIELRDKTVLLYPQGEVTLKGGAVTDIDLMSEEQFQADQERLHNEREAWLAEQERLTAINRAEGEAIRAEKVTSRSFAAMPAKEKVDYWRRFQSRYPTIDVSEQIGSALESYESELKELRSQQRIAELEARVAQAEKEATQARIETQKLKEDADQQKLERPRGLRYGSTPVVGHYPYYYRPPTVTIYTGDKEQNSKSKHEEKQTVQHPWRRDN